MKPTFFILVCLTLFSLQCKRGNDSEIPPVATEMVDVLNFSVPGIDPKNITVGKDLIVVYLPEDYTKGDFIKPNITFENGYSSKSPLLDGVSFEGQEIKLNVDSNISNPRSFDVIVVPYKAIVLAEPAENRQLTLDPEVSIKTSFELKGTRATINDSGKVVYNALIRFIDKTTGKITQELREDARSTERGNERTFTLPPAMLPGEYTVKVVWGTKTELFSSQTTIKPGVLQLMRGSWLMLSDQRNFKVTAYNISPTDKYEAIIQNDFVSPQRISLKYENHWTLLGSLPETIVPGNYKVTYLINGNEQKPCDSKNWLDKYSGDDNFYIQKNSTQPILRIVTQPSRRSYFSTPRITDLPYYPSASVINRKEPILAYTQSWGAFPDKNEMILVNQVTGTEYTLPYSGNWYPIFDGFLTFLSYPIPDEVPNGNYAVYVIRGTEKTEVYSQIITLK